MCNQSMMVKIGGVETMQGNVMLTACILPGGVGLETMLGDVVTMTVCILPGGGWRQCEVM